MFKFPALVIAGLMIFINTLFNLIPFFRADGYWLLSDVFSTPHIMQKAFERIKTTMTKNGWIEIKRWKKKDYLFFAYGIFAYSFTGLFVLYILFRQPHSIIYLPVNLFHFIQSVFHQNAETSLKQIFDFIPPIIFYVLVFKWIKKLLINQMFSRFFRKFKIPIL